jgi:hypothetical protein
MRRTRRAVRLGAAIAAQSAASLPTQTHQWSDSDLQALAPVNLLLAGSHKKHRDGLKSVLSMNIAREECKARPDPRVRVMPIIQDLRA